MKRFSPTFRCLRPAIRRWLFTAAAIPWIGFAPIAKAEQTEDVKLLRPNGSATVNFGNATAIEGNRMLVGSVSTDESPGGVFLYDVTDPENPVLLSELIARPNLPLYRGVGISVALSGNLAFFSDSTIGEVYVFDITAPLNPVLKSTLTHSEAGYAFGDTLAANGNLVAVSGSSYTVLFDVTDPANPVFLSKVLSSDFNDRPHDSGLTIAGDLLVVGNQNETFEDFLGLRIPTGAVFLFDISDPTQPVRLSKIMKGTRNGRFGSATAVSGDLLFVGEEQYGSHHNPYQRRGAVSIFDISDPEDPKRLSRFVSPLHIKLGTSVSLVGQELLAGGARGGTTGRALLLDVSDPTSITEIARLEPSDSIGDDAAIHFGFSVAFNGRTAVVGAPRDVDPVLGEVGSVNLFEIDRVSIPDLEDSDDTGRSRSDNVTQNTTPVFSGLAAPGEMVELFSDVAGSLGSTTADSDGKWTVAVGSPLSEAVHQITASGSSGFVTNALAVTIDTTPPGAPTLLDLIDQSDSGPSNSDNHTRFNQPVIAGEAESDSIVTLFSDLNGEVGRGLANSPFSIECAVALDDGPHIITASAIDRAGNRGPISGSLSISIDTQGPGVTLNQAAGQPDPADLSPILFTAIFDEPVFGFDQGDVFLSGTAGAITKTVTEVAPNDGTTFRVDVGGIQQDGTVIATLRASAATDLAGNPSSLGTATDNEVLFDAANPAVTINQGSQGAAQNDPTNQSPILFQVIFSEPVTGFESGDVTLSGTAGATTVDVTGEGTTYDVSVSGMTNDGTVIATVGAGVAQDIVGKGNLASTSDDNEVTYDTTPPTVTIDQAITQADPAAASPVHFTVQFSEPVTGLLNAEILRGGSAGPTAATVTEIAPNDATTYDVAVSGMTGDGLVTAAVVGTAAFDAAGNSSVASTSTDNSVVYDAAPPAVVVSRAATQSDPTTSNTIRFTAVFSEPVTGFESGEVLLSGTAGATAASVSETGPMDGTTYNLAVTGMTREGSVTAAIGAGVAVDQVGKPNTASSGADNTVEFDVHGGTRETATALVFGGSSATGNGSLAGADWDYFEFTLTEALHISIFTEGDLDTIGRLFDAAGNRLNSFSADDDRGIGRNFRIDIPLAPGTYFIEVSGRGGAQRGAYRLRIEKGAPARAQPDNHVGKSPTRMVGNNVYTGVQRDTLVSANARKVRGYLGIQNDGQVTDRFSVFGTRGTKLFKVIYSGRGGNITAGITAGRYRTEAAGPGAAPQRVTIVVRPKRSRLKKTVGSGSRTRTRWLKKKLTLQLSSTSMIDRAASDTVLLQVKTK